MKKGHQNKKDHEKLRGHKSSHSPSRRKSSLSKRLMSPGRKRSPSPGSRKSHKISPGVSKHGKSKSRSGIEVIFDISSYLLNLTNVYPN